MNQPRVQIVPLQFEPIPMLQNILSLVSAEIGWPAVISPLSVDISFTFDPVRRQHHSSQLILGLKNLLSSHTDKLLAITSVDLFIPILTFVFGEAQLDGPIAVVSCYRLRPEYYGLPVNDQLLQERLTKEVIHELGHTFGLRHCPVQACALHASTYAEEIDLKSVHFCADCRDRIESKKQQLHQGEELGKASFG